VLILHGMTPGPQIFVQNPVLIGSIYVSLMISAFIMVFAHAVLVRWFTKIALVPFEILAPVVLMLSAVGIFALDNNLFDIWVLFGSGVAGYLMWKAGVPLTPFILGVVLGENLETQVFRALELDSSWLTFATRPISATLLALSVASVIFATIQNRRIAAQAPIGGESQSSLR